MKKAKEEKTNGKVSVSKRNGTAGAAAAAGLGSIDRFLALSDYEKEEIFREFDRPLAPSQTRPLNAAERRQWERAKKKVGRPKIGAGTQAISITVEKNLLAWADEYANDKGLTRTRLISMALESLRDDVRRYRLIESVYDRKNTTSNGKTQTVRRTSLAD